jgi:hypothetical protein
MDEQLAALQEAYDNLVPAMRKQGVRSALRTVAKPALEAYRSYARSFYSSSKVSYYKTKKGKVKVRRMKGRLEGSAGTSTPKAKWLGKDETGVTVGYRMRKGGHTAIWLADGTKPRITSRGFNRGQMRPTQMRRVTSSQAEAISLQAMPAELAKQFNRQAKKVITEDFEPIAKRYQQQILREALRK